MDRCYHEASWRSNWSCRGAACAVWDPAAEFVFASPHVPRHDVFLAYAQPSFGRDRPLLEAARELMERVHADFVYEPEATDVSTPALEALEMRRGVCQDFAHVMLACLRSLGLPARYVSGYMLTEPPPGYQTPSPDQPYGAGKQKPASNTPSDYLRDHPVGNGN